MATHYSVGPIAIALFVVYGASFVLYKTKRISVRTHRKIWNVLLLLTFLTTALFGLTLAIRRDYALLFSSPVNMLFWHVEAGVTMTVISLFHLSWHLTYYRDLFKRGSRECPAEGTGNGETATDETGKDRNGPPG
jgi:cytochrome bd-type quinol oxidase subunit 2